FSEPVHFDRPLSVTSPQTSRRGGLRLRSTTGLTGGGRLWPAQHAADSLAEQLLLVTLGQLVRIPQVVHAVAVVFPLFERPQLTTRLRYPAHAREVCAPQQAIGGKRFDDLVQERPGVLIGELA